MPDAEGAPQIPPRIAVRTRSQRTTIPCYKDARPGPLSAYQTGLWFLQHRAPTSPFYNHAAAFRIRGPLDATGLERAFGAVAARHETLRSAYPLRSDAMPEQRIEAHLALPLSRVDLSGLPSGAREAAARKVLDALAQRPFDLTRAPLYRIALLRLEAEEHWLGIVLHHLICDGWSMVVMFREVERLYAAHRAGYTLALPPLPIQYGDFARWQRERLEAGGLQAALDYWTERLLGFETLALATDLPRPAIASFRGAVRHFRVPALLTSAVADLGRRVRATPFAVILAAFQTLLHRFTGQGDIALGCPIAQRTPPELEELIGLFVNVAVLRSDLSCDPPFVQLVESVRRTVFEAQAHLDAPFERIVRALQPLRDPGVNPLFGVSLSFENFPLPIPHLEGLAVETLDVHTGTSKFDLTLTLTPSGGELESSLEYSTDLFTSDTIDRLQRSFLALLRGAAQAPESCISGFPILADADRQQVVELSATRASAPKPSCVHEQFQAQAARTPEAVALRARPASCAPRALGGSVIVSYDELERRANQLSHALVARGVVLESLVGIYLEPEVDAVVALLAVLKAGGAYVPLDPELPEEHTRRLIAGAGVHSVVTRADLAARLGVGGAQPLCIDSDATWITAHPDTPPPVATRPDHLAYVLFTSGSTGRPKPVAVSHRALHHYLDWAGRTYRLGEGRGALVHTPLAVDLTVTSVLGPLLEGGSLLLPGSTGVAPLVETLQEESDLTLVKLTPSHLVLLRRELADQTLLGCARVLVVGGEALHYEVLDALRRSAPAMRIINEYGPTETVVGCCTYEVARGDPDVGPVPIGRPIPNTCLHVLDPHLEPLPVGVAGELFIGGGGVARGYLGSPTLTAERFVPDPFSDETGARMYRTGDRVRWRRDGELEYLGRRDHQVKIRGHRVETEEVAAALREHPAVREAVVVPRGEGPDRHLVAFVTEATDGTDALRATHVARWETLYDAVYQSDVRDGDDDAFDTAGWTSSYTGQPLSATEMRDWADQIVTAVQAREPGRVLEIGCGTGILLFRLLPSCARYHGTDVSTSCVKRLAERLSEHRITRATVERRAADDFERIESESFDTVILNSVVQYFPDVHYLFRVLDGALRATAEGGRVFIGDVRSLPLLEAFHASVELLRAGPGDDVASVRRRVAVAAAREAELVLGPELFRAYAARHPRVRGIDLLLHRGRYRNELVKFRYQVILTVGAPLECGPEPPTARVDGSGLTLARLRRTLETERALEVRCMPNARVRRDVRAAQALRDAAAERPADGLLAAEVCASEVDREDGIDPEDVWDLAATLGRRVRIGPSLDAPDCFDARFDALGAPSLPGRPGHLQSVAEPPWELYANQPLLALRRERLAAACREHASRVIPGHMVPASIQVIDALPLTSTGKVDHRALPEPDAVRLAPSRRPSRAVPPATEAERHVAQVWCELLGLEHVGLDRNFFELGGHSFLLLQVQQRLEEILDVSLSIVDLFRYATVRTLAQRVAGSPGNDLPRSAVARAELRRANRGSVMRSRHQRASARRDPVE